KNGFLAGTPGIDVASKMQSLTKGILSGEGFFILKLSGTGTAFLHTYGSIYTIDIPAGEQILIDNGHLVAWSSDMKYSITKGAASWVSSVTSGEGLACRFTGPGRVLIQTRNPSGFGSWLFPYLPIPKPSSR
ncbi:MAG: AIM24 family protein, partial [Alphaproteobacteria bacterium]|nr:AIM24 family protein [Alphaproteobacteria bacterium]